MLNSEKLFKEMAHVERECCDWMHLSTGVLVSPVHGELLCLTF